MKHEKDIDQKENAKRRRRRKGRPATGEEWVVCVCSP